MEAGAVVVKRRTDSPFCVAYWWPQWRWQCGATPEQQAHAWTRSTALAASRSTGCLESMWTTIAAWSTDPHSVRRKARGSPGRHAVSARGVGAYGNMRSARHLA